MATCKTESNVFGAEEVTFATHLKKRIKYFQDNSSLRGVGHVISLSKITMFKRLFWFVTLVACCICSASVLYAALSLYSEDAVSYSVETDYLKWDTPFPAVTICETMNDTRVKNALVLAKVPQILHRFSKEIGFWSKTFCKFCATCKIDQTCVDDFLPLVGIVRSSCEELMTDCWFGDEHFPCCERFKPIATEYGVCFVFNSRLTGDGSIKYINRKVNLPTLVFSALWAVMIRIHSPDELVTISTQNLLGTCSSLPRMSDFNVELKVEQTTSDISVRSIARDSRDCLFTDELPKKSDKWPFGYYSYSACVWYCKSVAHVSVCNCTYHFMPRIDQVPVCDIQGLKCLYANKELLSQEKCLCPMDCEETAYKAIHTSCFRRTGISEEIEPRGTQGSVRISHLPSLRVRRQAIRDMLGLVVDVGGVVGVFFGASLLSFIEIVYIFCVRKYH